SYHARSDDTQFRPRHARGKGSKIRPARNSGSPRRNGTVCRDKLAIFAIPPELTYLDGKNLAKNRAFRNIIAEKHKNSPITKIVFLISKAESGAMQFPPAARHIVFTGKQSAEVQPLQLDPPGPGEVLVRTE